MERDVERRLGIADEIFGGDVILHEFARHRDLAKEFLRQVGHAGVGLDFGIGESRRLQHAALDELVGVANEEGALRASSLESQGEALNDRHFGHLLHQGLALSGVGFDFGCDVFDINCGHGGLLQIGEEFALLGIAGGDLGDGDDELWIGREALEIVEQGLNAVGGEVRCHTSDHRSGAGEIFCERVGDARFVGEILRAIGEEARVGILTGECG